MQELSDVINHCIRSIMTQIYLVLTTNPNQLLPFLEDGTQPLGGFLGYFCQQFEEELPQVIYYEL